MTPIVKSSYAEIMIGMIGEFRTLLEIPYTLAVTSLPSPQAQPRTP